MALDTSEEEQVEKIQTFLRQNGWFLAIGLVLVLGGNFGFRSWEDQKQAAAEAASDAFTTFQAAAREGKTDDDKRAAAMDLGDAFIANHPGTDYAVLAGLQIAKLHFSAGNLSEAEAALRAITAAASSQLAPLVQIRLARLLGAQDRPEEGLTVLAEPLEWAGFMAARHEVEGDLLYQLDRLDEARQELLDLADSDVSSVMTLEEATIHKNNFRSYHDDEQKLIANRGKVYVLILGQCTQVLKDALKEDDDWYVISSSYDAIALFQLIEKCVLKQTSNKYAYLVLQEEWRSLLMNKQEADHTTNVYYERMSNRVAILERVGGVFYTPELLEMETEVLHPGSSYAAIAPDEQQKVRGIVKEKYLATLFLDRSDKKHQELKDDVKNDYAKGNKNAFPPTISMAMQLMQEYRKLQPEKAVVPAQGTAFAQAGGKGGAKKSGRLSNEEWWALTPEARKKLDEKRKAVKLATEKPVDTKAKAKGKAKDDDDDEEQSVASLKKRLAKSESSLKSVTKCLVTLSEVGESDISEDGSNSLMAESFLCNDSPMLGAWYAQVKKSGGLRELNLRDEFLLDSQTTHNLCCNESYVDDIRQAGRLLNMSGNG